ncbi:SDR family NAD(P)-dependent oxidoreductase [Streptomyces sp. LN590]|uniref:SDR family NAD(P)-dependent oxidoreductase n=1 Tax=Streptomyces sp. LN590 TaxID=3112980 RepID=UPI003717BAAF
MRSASRGAGRRRGEPGQSRPRLSAGASGRPVRGRRRRLPGARDHDHDHDHDQMMVNVVALVDLTHELLPGMLERGHGSVVNVASNAAFQPSPYFAVYGAAKAFVLNFGLALRQEYRRRGIRVLTLCPGPVETAFFDTIGTRRAAITGSMTTPGPVVRAALRALERDRGYVAPGFGNALAAHLTPRRPRTL